MPVVVFGNYYFMIIIVFGLKKYVLFALIFTLIPIVNRFLSRDDKISYTLADPSLKMLFSLISTVREDNNDDNLNSKVAALSALGFGRFFIYYFFHKISF